jgi:hypothetical protein
MSFEKQIREFALKAEKQAQLKVRKVCFDLVAELDKTTPRDTGRLANNWQASVNQPAQGELSRTSGAINANQAQAGKAFGNIFYVVNNLPYAAVAEYGLWGTGAGATERTTRDGYSVQAPYGFARIAYQRAKQSLK